MTVESTSEFNDDPARLCFDGQLDRPAACGGLRRSTGMPPLSLRALRVLRGCFAVSSVLKLLSSAFVSFVSVVVKFVSVWDHA